MYVFGGRGYVKGTINDLPDSKNTKLNMITLQDVMVADLSTKENLCRN